MKETKYISEVEYLTFKQNLRDTFIRTFIGFCIGILFFFTADADAALPERIMGLLMITGLPCAWTIMPFYANGLISLFLKFIVCLMIGWLIAPVMLIYNFVQMKRYENHIAYYEQLEETEKLESIQRENYNFDRVVKAITSNTNKDFSSLNNHYKTLQNHIVELLNEFAETTASADAIANIGIGDDYLKSSIITTMNAFTHQYEEIQRLNEKIKNENPDYSKIQYIIDEMEEHYATMLRLQHQLMKETQESLTNHRDYQTATQSSSAGSDESLFHGCTDKESLTKRYRSLMKIYHPDNSDGDLSMTQKIQYTYEKLLNKFS